MKLEELLLRRLDAQHLLTPVPSHQAAGNLCGLQAQFLRNSIHALRIRTDKLSTDGLIKTWTLRNTVHLIPEADLPLYLRRCGGADAVCDSAWYVWTASRRQANPPETERRYARLMLDAISQGIDTRDTLRLHLQAHGMTETEEARLFNPWGGLISELANVGALAFQINLSDETHANEEKRYRLLAPFIPLPEAEARLQLLRRYFTHYGPATLRDAAYFFHWTQTEIKALLPQLPLESAVVDGRKHFWIKQADPSGNLPCVCLLAGFDPLMLGYRKEDNPFLPAEHLRGIFNLAGIVNPAILLHGRVVGKWKEKNGKVELTAFESISSTDRRCIEQEAARLFQIRKLIWKE